KKFGPRTAPTDEELDEVVDEPEPKKAAAAEKPTPVITPATPPPPPRFDARACETGEEVMEGLHQLSPGIDTTSLRSFMNAPSMRPRHPALVAHDVQQAKAVRVREAEKLKALAERTARDAMAVSPAEAFDMAAEATRGGDWHRDS